MAVLLGLLTMGGYICVNSYVSPSIAALRFSSVVDILFPFMG
jgi:hypothetical protein